MWKTLLIGGAAMALGACASIPAPLTGTFRDVKPAAAATANGAQVRWGGRIIETAPGPDQTCIYAMARPLDRTARPTESGDSLGRFVACRAGFYDPEIFAKGRAITVTGTLDGTVTRKVGDYNYPYPKIDANNVYLWPVQQQIARNYYDPFYDPFWGPRFYDPFWYGRPSVIVVQPKPGNSQPPSGNGNK